MKMPIEKDDAEREVFASIVMLVSRWTSVSVQAQIADLVGVDISDSDIRVLFTIGLSGGSARPASLAADLGTTRPTMSKSLSRLTSAGLLQRDAGALEDGRAVRFTLTHTGARTYEQLSDAGLMLTRTALSAFTPSEVRRFAKVMTQLLTAFPSPAT